MPTQTAISIDHLSFSYGKHPVLLDFSLEVSEGSIHGIVGPNGTGKTTLFNCLFLHQQYVAITVAPGLEKEIAYLQTDTYFYPYMTGMEYLRLISGKRREEQLSRWKDVFDLPLQDYVHHYSTGMKKKIALLGVLLLNKQILILDEPTNGLDLDSCEVVYLILKHLKAAGKTVLLSSHIYETLAHSCDRITLMNGLDQPMTYERSGFNKLALHLKGGYQKKFGDLLEELLAG